MQSSQGKKLKVLCLHGIGTCSDVFETQTAALRLRLGDGLDYDFVQGAHPWPAAPGVAEAFGTDQVYYSYVDGTARGATEAIDALGAYAAEAGPFDVVLGFSLGSALAATLLLRSEQQRQPPAFRSAVFISGTLPADWEQLQKGTVGFLRACDVKARITIPTVHAWDPEDLDYPGQSDELLQMCGADNRIQVRHSAGHGVPSQDGEVVALVDAIEKILAGLDASVGATWGQS